MERETGIGPATNSLEGCDSTTELLPLISATLQSCRSPTNLELMMGLEPMTSPLPRECSTTELHQPLNVPSIRRRYALHPTRPEPAQHHPEREKSKQQPRKLLVLPRLHRQPHCQRKRQKHKQRENHPSGTAGLHRHASLLPPGAAKCGAQGRIRTSVTHCVADLQSAAINHSATCALLYPSFFRHPDAPRSPCRASHEFVEETAGGTTGSTSKLACAAEFWSWRRDSNPRPPDYKSGALPAELRQPRQHIARHAKRERT